jgi:outer membrane protein OmpA-like peptidoglycan-associated protein
MAAHERSLFVAADNFQKIEANRMKTNQTLRTMLAAVLAPALLAACGTTHVSRGIDGNGNASEVIFPDVDHIVMKGGTFPNHGDLKLIGPGVTKDQLYQLLGRPHFREGYAGVHEWDYLFNFWKDGKVVTCQYKVIFDKNYLGQSFHWLPADCPKLLDDAAPVTLVAADNTPVAEGTKFELSADVLFAFDRHGNEDVQPEGKRQIAEIAAKLQNARFQLVQVIGHTDLLGSELYNHNLSQRRALTVRQLLIEAGVPASRVVAIGAGKTQPVKQCDSRLPRTELKACLQPNRRVEIIVSGTK